jgi:NAD-dependent DNA ligase
MVDKILQYFGTLPRNANGQLMPLNDTKKEKDKFKVYMYRFQKKIEKQMKFMLDAAEKYPDQFLNVENKYIESKEPNHRVKNIYRMYMILNPKLQLEISRRE